MRHEKRLKLDKLPRTAVVLLLLASDFYKVDAVPEMPRRKLRGEYRRPVLVEYSRHRGRALKMSGGGGSGGRYGTNGGGSGGGGGSSGGGGHGTDYIGCLGLSSTELQSAWIFPSTPPACEYHHHAKPTNSGGNGNDDAADYEEQAAGDDEDEPRDDNVQEAEEAPEDEDATVNNEDFENVNEQNNGDQEVEEQQQQNDDEGNDDGAVNDNPDDDARDDAKGGQDDQQAADDNVDKDYDQYDPYDDFEIEQCDTYENLWMWDFSLSCTSEDSLENCECSFASELMQLGYLSCEDAISCPKSCHICSTCMRLLGCQPAGAVWGRVNSWFWVIVCVVIAICVLVLYVSYRCQRSNDGSSTGSTANLATHLISEDHDSLNEGEGGKRIWLAPVGTASWKVKKNKNLNKDHGDFAAPTLSSPPSSDLSNCHSKSDEEDSDYDNKNENMNGDGNDADSEFDESDSDDRSTPSLDNEPVQRRNKIIPVGGAVMARGETTDEEDTETDTVTAGNGDDGDAPIAAAAVGRTAAVAVLPDAEDDQQPRVWLAPVDP